MYSGWFTQIIGQPSPVGWVQDRESSQVRDRRSTAMPYQQLLQNLGNYFRICGGCDWYVVYWQDITGWGENDRGVSFTFGGDIVRQFLKKHNFSLIARAHQVHDPIISCIFVLLIHFLFS